VISQNLSSPAEAADVLPFGSQPRKLSGLRVGEGPRALGFSIVLLKISSSSASSWSYSLDCNDIVSDAHQVSSLEACLPS
jgi:hypothetical protein